MILNEERLGAAIKTAGVSIDDLAEAVARESLSPAQAHAAINNWLRGGSSPKAKVADIRALASTLNVQILDIAQFDASHRWARISARKARLVADMIRDEDIDSALSMLRFSKKRAAYFAKKTLEAAIASAEENQADVTRLRVSMAKVDEGPTLKRFQPKDRGRAHPINKRTSHIQIAVQED